MTTLSRITIETSNEILDLDGYKMDMNKIDIKRLIGWDYWLDALHAGIGAVALRILWHGGRLLRGSSKYTCVAATTSKGRN